MRCKQAILVLAGALALATTMVSDALAQRPYRFGEHPRNREWQLLGQKEVRFRVDRDIINIGQSEDWYRSRAFRSLHFVAHGNDVHMISVRLVYINGYSEDFRLDRVIRPNEDLPLDLRGERSYLRQIEMTYRSRPSFQGRATIAVYGEPARRGPPVATPLPPAGPPGAPPFPPPGRGGPEAWVELGCKQVALVGRDRDTIDVGRREGRFQALRLHVRGADVEMRELKVIYANGEPDDLLVRTRVRAGDRTRRLDLKGRERAIDRIDLTYRTALNPVDIIAKQRISTATVCVEGLQ